MTPVPALSILIGADLSGAQPTMTATPANEDHCLRDSEVALTDAIATILEIIIAKGILPPKVLDQALKMQSDKYPADEMPRAVFIFDELRRVPNDPGRAQLRQLDQKPPAGSA
jgi:hypothetical protein